MHKIVRITTVPESLKYLLRGQFRFMSENGYEVVGISSEGKEMEDISNEEGIKMFPIEMSRKITPLKDLKSLLNLYILLKKQKPFIVHTHTPKAGIVGMVASRLAGVPHRLHTVAGLPLMEATGMKRKLLDIVEKLTYSCATKVYPNSKGLYNFIVENKYTKRDKLKIIGNGSSNGINTTYFSMGSVSEEQKNRLKQDLGIQPGDFVFVFVGRMVGDKGIYELVSAFKGLKVVNLRPENPCAPFTILHSPIASSEPSQADNPQQTTHNRRPKLLLVGPFEPELDPLSKVTLEEIKANPDIISTGFQPDVRPYFAIADALAFPSYREGFPNVVMQAGAMELPSIVTDINGCNEIIIDGENGIIIPPKNSNALLKAMEKLMNDKNYYNRLKQNARRMITERYEQHIVWEAILAEYKTLGGLNKVDPT